MSHRPIWRDFDIREILGEGQSGVVHRAELRRRMYGLQVGASIAVKRYKPWVLEQPGFIERMYAEVNVGKEALHPNLLRIYGAVIDAEGRPALAMEYHVGQTLADILIKRRSTGEQIDFATAVGIVRDVACGLESLHAVGATHRDVKPANILIGERGAVLADFGVVRVDSLAEQTTTDVFLGSIRYAAPEYLFGENYTERSDIYSLGCVAHEIFTSEEAFANEQNWAKVVALKSVKRDVFLSRRQLELMQRVFGTLPTEFAYALIHACMQRDPRSRPPLVDISSAVDEHAWRYYVRLRKGRLERGPLNHRDYFGTAQNAATRLREVLTPGQMRELNLYVKRNYWPDDDPDSVGPGATKWMLDTRAVEFTQELTPYWYISESVREAYALGLLESVSPS